MAPTRNTRVLSRRQALARRIGLWAAQVVLCAGFGMSGVTKVIMSPEAMTGMGIAWAVDVPL